MVPAASSDPRSLLLSQPQLIFVLFAGAVWLFKFINRAKTAASSRSRGPQEAAQPEPDGQGGPIGQDADEEERTRRVREDILRKITERRAGAAVRARALDERRAPGPPAIAKMAAYGSRGSAEGTAAAGSPGPRLHAIASSGGPPAVPSAGALWLDDLRSRDSARRAILVREILGPPVALR